MDIKNNHVNIDFWKDGYWIIHVIKDKYCLTYVKGGAPDISFLKLKHDTLIQIYNGEIRDNEIMG